MLRCLSARQLDTLALCRGMQEMPTYTVLRSCINPEQSTATHSDPLYALFPISHWLFICFPASDLAPSVFSLSPLPGGQADIRSSSRNNTNQQTPISMYEHKRMHLYDACVSKLHRRSCTILSPLSSAFPGGKGKQKTRVKCEQGPRSVAKTIVG